MKKWLGVILCGFLLFSSAAVAQNDAPTNLSFAPLEQNLPAVGLRLYVPADMDHEEGDVEAYELGYRFNCFNDTFYMSANVRSNREMTMPEYTAFYSKKKGYTAAREEINEIAVERLTDQTNPQRFEILISMFVDQDSAPGDEFPVYHLLFDCKTQADLALATEILSTLQYY